MSAAMSTANAKPLDCLSNINRTRLSFTSLAHIGFILKRVKYVFSPYILLYSQE
jgi:hypothetical protein